MVHAVILGHQCTLSIFSPFFPLLLFFFSGWFFPHCTLQICSCVLRKDALWHVFCCFSLPLNVQNKTDLRSALEVWLSLEVVCMLQLYGSRCCLLLFLSQSLVKPRVRSCNYRCFYKWLHNCHALPGQPWITTTFNLSMYWLSSLLALGHMSLCGWKIAVWSEPFSTLLNSSLKCSCYMF